MAPISRRVDAAGKRGIESKRNPARVSPADFFEPASRVREKFADLIGDRSGDRVAMIPSVSYGISNVVANLKLRRGDKILVVEGQFPSNVYPWMRLAQRTGAEIITIKPPEESSDRGEVWNERILSAIGASTRVVALGPVHWADGTRFDLERIGARARDLDASLIIDGTQGIGAMPFSIEKVRPDAVVCAAYKWLMGPYSTGFGWYGPRFDDGIPIEENWITRLGSDNFAGLVDYEIRYQPGARRYDVGEYSNFALMPMVEEALDQVREWNPEAIAAYCAALVEPRIQEMREMGCLVEEKKWRASHLFGIRLPERIDLEKTKSLLSENRVFVSIRGNAIRVSPHVYNDAENMDALIHALASVIG